MKNIGSYSFVQRVKDILCKYDLPSIFQLIKDPPTKEVWKRCVKKAVKDYWREILLDAAAHKVTLQFLDIARCVFGDVHPAWGSCQFNSHDIHKAGVKVKLLLGVYQTQAVIARQKNGSPSCMLCGKEPEDVQHFLLRCDSLSEVRQNHLEQLRSLLSSEFGDNAWCEATSNDDRYTQIILDAAKEFGQLRLHILYQYETISRNLIYRLHCHRAIMLGGRTNRWRFHKL